MNPADLLYVSAGAAGTSRGLDRRRTAGDEPMANR